MSKRLNLMVILVLNESYHQITWSENLRVIAPFEIQKWSSGMGCYFAFYQKFFLKVFKLGRN